MVWWEWLVLVGWGHYGGNVQEGGLEFGMFLGGNGYGLGVGVDCESSDFLLVCWAWSWGLRRWGPRSWVKLCMFWSWRCSASGSVTAVVLRKSSE